MKEFFSSVRFKVLVGVAIVLCAFMLRAAWTGGFGTVTSSLLGAVTAPLQKLSSSISYKVDGFFSTFTDARKIRQENEALKEEIRRLNERMSDYDEMKHKYEAFEDFLGIKEDRDQKLEYEPASVMGRDASDRFYSFTIDKGSLDGVGVRNVVIAADGMVGVVSEVGLVSSKVQTILDPAINIGVYDTRTRDTGLITGTVELAEQGLCKFSYLPRESGAARGDLVETSSVSGKYPSKQIVGKIVDVLPESHGNSLYAVVQPAANIKTVKDVLVIKSFAGQEPASSQAGEPDSEEEGEPGESGASQSESASGGGDSAPEPAGEE